MMDPSETHNFEDQWRKAFDDASETPPPSVWEGIEARLDQDERTRIVPIWWRSPKLWYAAASIAALLLVGGGIWYNYRPEAVNRGAAGIASKTPSPIVSEQEVIENADTQTHETGANVAIASSGQKPAHEPVSEKGKIPSRDRDDASDLSNGLVAGKSDSRAGSQKVGHEGLTGSAISETPALAKTNELVAKKEQVTRKVEVGNESRIAIDISAERNKPDGKAAIINEKMGSASSDGVSMIAENGSVQQPAIQVELLTPLAYSDLDVYMQKRYVFYKQEAAAEEKLPEMKKNREYWAGIGFMPASFNPEVKITSAPTLFSNLATARQNSTSGRSRSGNSYAVQTQGGVRISKHWSIETGVSYLQGNSQYEGGGYVLSAYSAKSANVLEGALAGLTSKPGTQYTPTIGADNSQYLDLNKRVSNNYQFLQLPMQAGFTLRPDKKLSYSLLGGMMANFFLNNELESASGDIITTRASDEVYKSMNWAATTGLRFSYRMSSKWNANLTGSYQRAVSSGFRTNQSLESHPYLYGVSWGVRYSF